MAVLITADTHFFHAGIAQHCPDTRPFRNASEMNDAIVAAWRATVHRDDDVWVVGDFSYRHPDAKALRRMFDALPGRKHLVIGNHDGEDTLALPWEQAVTRALTVIEGSRVVLDHYAMRTWPGMRKGTLQLFGHSHGRMPGNSRSCDVGVDVFGFAPVRLNVVKAHLATLPPFEDPEVSSVVGGLKP
jgi:calcineurin-like phosphoesterase family protein